MQIKVGSYCQKKVQWLLLAAAVFVNFGEACKIAYGVSFCKNPWRFNNAFANKAVQFKHSNCYAVDNKGTLATYQHILIIGAFIHQAFEGNIASMYQLDTVDKSSDKGQMIGVLDTRE